ncbi:MAG TPA: hypothetical protein VEW42_04405 [Candidatus Eisenbacteria bacterium]|nr:hypothetical protein [Candidatus Eisenbacteria bacterium]
MTAEVRKPGPPSHVPDVIPGMMPVGPHQLHKAPEFAAKQRTETITFPKDADRARLYHYSETGEVIPNQDVLFKMATIVVDSVKVKPGGKLLTYLAVEDEAGLAYANTVIAVAQAKGITDIHYLDRRPSIELERIKAFSQMDPQQRADAIEELMVHERAEMKWADGIAAVRYTMDPQFTAQMTDEEHNAYEEMQHARMYSPHEGEEESKKGPDKIRLQEREWMGASQPRAGTAKADSIVNGYEISHENQIYYWLKGCERNPHEILKSQEKLAVHMSNSRRIRVMSTPPEKNMFFKDPRFVTDLVVVTQIVKDGQVVPRRWDNHAGLEKNFPGSEVFGAPSDVNNPAELGQYKEVITGQLAYPFPVMFEDVLLSNISLRYQHGRLASWEIVGDDADPEIIKQRAHFAKVLAENPGVDRIGESAMGTNQYPPYSSIDIGLNEKRTGVHFALGMSYLNQKDETGVMADLDNGNGDCKVHADLILPMTPENPGQLWAEVDVPQNDGSIQQEWTLILADGAFVKKLDNGQYVADEDLKVINYPAAHIEPFDAPEFTALPESLPDRRSEPEAV